MIEENTYQLNKLKNELKLNSDDQDQVKKKYEEKIKDLQDS